VGEVDAHVDRRTEALPARVGHEGDAARQQTRGTIASI
jgi:hypothetical protein